MVHMRNFKKVHTATASYSMKILYNPDAMSGFMTSGNCFFQPKTVLLKIPPRNREVNCLSSQVRPWGPLEEWNPPGNMRRGQVEHRVVGTTSIQLIHAGMTSICQKYNNLLNIDFYFGKVYQHYEKIINMTMKTKLIVECRDSKTW